MPRLSIGQRQSQKVTAVLGTLFLTGGLFLVTNPGGFAASPAGAAPPASIPLQVDPTPPNATPPGPPADHGPVKGKGALHVGKAHPGADEATQPLWVEVLDQLPDGSPVVSNTTAVGYTPAQITQYLGLTGDGYGMTIAIVDAYHHPNIKSDLTAFDTAFGLAAPLSFKQVSQSGSTTVFPTVNSSWALETALDVEWAHAIAPRANLVLVEAASAGYADLTTAIAYAAAKAGAVVISNSWGSTEWSGEATYDAKCKLTTALCIFASGDAGNPGMYPAYSPWVLAVGGTTLQLNSNGTVASEGAWSGSGGGISVYEGKPAFQSSVNTTRRAIPDVSFDGDPSTGFAVYNTVPYSNQTGWFQVGGTSAGAPQWAGIVAAADGLRKAVRKSVLVGYNSSTLASPAMAAIYSATSGISDITSGAPNGTCGTVCTPAPGFDFVTGRGSPRPGIDVALKAAP